MSIKKDLFIIGDSISIHYGPWLESYVKDYFLYDRRGGLGKVKKFEPKNAGSNSRDSGTTLSYVKKIISKGHRADLIAMNCGLHDIKADPETGKKQVKLDEYKKNLKAIFDIIQKASIHLIWIRTTPVVDNIHNRKDIDFHRHNKDVLEYNKVADELAESNGIPEIDLYGFTEKLNEDMDIYCDHVHFHENVRMLQAAFISGYILAFDAELKRNGKK